MSLSTGEYKREFPDHRPEEAQPQWRRDFPTEVPEDDLVARREFTKFMVLTSGAFVAGQCWIAAHSHFRREGPWPEKQIAAADQVSAGSVVEFTYPGDDQRCLLMRLEDQSLVAYGQECSHLACAVVPRLEEGHLHCPCHNGYFDLRDGRPIAGPPRRPLPRITLVERDGQIFATGVELRTA
jgi:nitrite reductase/ring-hydroxylating ferredoxin subunit